MAERAGSGAPRCSSIPIPVPPRMGAKSSLAWRQEALRAWSPDQTLRNNPLPLPGPLLPSTSETCKHHQRQLILYCKARLCSGQEETPQQPVYRTGHRQRIITESIFCWPYSSWRLHSTPSPVTRGMGCKRGAGGEGEVGLSPQPTLRTPRGPQSIDGRSKALPRGSRALPCVPQSKGASAFGVHSSFEKRKLVLPVAA